METKSVWVKRSGNLGINPHQEVWDGTKMGGLVETCWKGISYTPFRDSNTLVGDLEPFYLSIFLI